MIHGDADVCHRSANKVIKIPFTFLSDILHIYYIELFDRMNLDVSLFDTCVSKSLPHKKTTLQLIKLQCCLQIPEVPEGLARFFVRLFLSLFVGKGRPGAQSVAASRRIVTAGCTTLERSVSVWPKPVCRRVSVVRGLVIARLFRMRRPYAACRSLPDAAPTTGNCRGWVRRGNSVFRGRCRSGSCGGRRMPVAGS